MVRSLMRVEFGECILYLSNVQISIADLETRGYIESVYIKNAQMLLMVGWFSCIFSESTQRVTQTIPGTLHSWIHAQHNTTHLPVASRVDCCLFAVTCRASSTSATHVGIDSIDVLVSVHWLRFPIQFHRINPPKVKRRGPGYDGHDVCNVPFDSQQSLRGSYWNPNHSTMLYEQVSKQFTRVMKFSTPLP